MDNLIHQFQTTYNSSRNYLLAIAYNVVDSQFLCCYNVAVYAAQLTWLIWLTKYVILFQVTIGYKQYQYACLKYADHSWRLALIIGLTAGLAAFALLLAIIITVCIVRRRRRKIIHDAHSHQHSEGRELRHRNEQPESQQNVNIIHKRENTITMYKPYDDYLPYLQPDSL